MSYFKKIFRDFSLWFMWFPFRKLICYIPWQLAIMIGSFLGDIIYYLFSGMRRDLIHEIRFLYSKTEKAPSYKDLMRIARGSMKQFGKRQIENMLWGKFSRKVLDQNLVYEGIEYLDEALKHEKGVLLCTAHYGSFLLGPIGLGFRNYPVHQLTGSPLSAKQSAMHERVFRYRKKVSDRLPIQFHIAKNSLPKVYKLLKANQVVVVAFDGREGTKWEQVPFMGHRANFSAGIFRIAKSSEAAILPVFPIAMPHGRYRIVIGPPFKLIMKENGLLDQNATVAAFAKKLELNVLDHPDHFGMTLLSHFQFLKQGLVSVSMLERNDY